MTTKKNHRHARVRMSGKAIRDLRAALDIDVAALATALSVHPSTVYRWEATKWPALSRAMVAQLTAVARLDAPALMRLGERIKAAAAADTPLIVAGLFAEAASKAAAKAKAKAA